MQLLAESKAWYDGGMHVVHCDNPTALEYEPAAHTPHPVDINEGPTEPMGQMVQAVDCCNEK